MVASSFLHVVVSGGGVMHVVIASVVVLFIIRVIIILIVVVGCAFFNPSPPLPLSLSRGPPHYFMGSTTVCMKITEMNFFRA